MPPRVFALLLCSVIAAAGATLALAAGLGMLAPLAILALVAGLLLRMGR